MCILTALFLIFSNLDSGKEVYKAMHSRKRRAKISEIVKFGGEILRNKDDIWFWKCARIVQVRSKVMSYWTSCLMSILHDPSSRVTKVSYTINIFKLMWIKYLLSTFSVVQYVCAKHLQFDI